MTDIDSLMTTIKAEAEALRKENAELRREALVVKLRRLGDEARCCSDSPSGMARVWDLQGMMLDLLLAEGQMWNEYFREVVGPMPYGW